MEIVKLTTKVLYDVRLIRDKVTDMSRGFAFIELGTTEVILFFYPVQLEDALKVYFYHNYGLFQPASCHYPTPHMT